MMDHPIENIKIGQPAHRALQGIGCETLEQLSQYSEEDLLALHGFGPKALSILKPYLLEQGLSLKETERDECDLVHSNGVKEKKLQVIDGFTIKYHANGKTIWSKGKMVDDLPEGYWEWYRPNGTLKRSGYFEKGEPVGEWITYDDQGLRYKATERGKG